MGQLKAAHTLTDQLIKADFEPGDSLYLKGLIYLTEVREVNVFKKIGTAKKALKLGSKRFKRIQIISWPYSL